MKKSLKTSKLNFLRQEGLVKPEKLAQLKVTLIGAGSVGSFTALALTKMGITQLEVYDTDGVSDHNLPNQFFRIKDAEKSEFKVNALAEILEEFNGVKIEKKLEKYCDQPLSELTILATDSMVSRKAAWEQYKNQGMKGCFIDSRMGGELGMVYKVDGIAHSSEYEETLYSDENSEELPCSARTIIYNVLSIAGLICRTVKSYAVGEKGYPWEVVFDMMHMMFMERR